MSFLAHRNRCKRLLFFMLILSFILPSAAVAAHLRAGSETGVEDCFFSVLILGDSQMAGDGWNGGYANCIKEAYPNAQVINLAKSGSLLVNGNIHAQWEFFQTANVPMPDFVLFDGGINDLCQKKETLTERDFALVKEAFCSLLESIHKRSPDTHIIYTLLPPVNEWKDSEKGPPSYDVQAYYWKQINIIASSYDYVTVLDLFSLNPFHFPCVECYREYFADSIHLSESGYRKTFEYIDNILMLRLAKKLVE